MRKIVGLICLFLPVAAAAQTFTDQANYLHSIIKTAPRTGTWSSISTAFTGDLRHVNLPISHTITGSLTLGNPANGYLYTDEAYALAGYLFNSSGQNHDLGDNGGRTAAVFSRVHVYQHGQGDSVAYNATCFMDSTLPGATSWLAEPACTLFNGDASAGANGQYLNPYETVISDGGFDVAGVGTVDNLNRTVSRAALGEYWAGVRIQSTGTAEIDAALTAAGRMRTLVDQTAQTLDTNKAFVVSVRGARWYGNATPGAYVYATPGLDWITDDPAIAGWVFAVNNTPSLQVTQGQVTTTTPLAIGSFVRQAATTVSGLASGDPNPQAGDKWFVTDATACSFNSAVTGGGSTKCPVVYSGAAWVAG